MNLRYVVANSWEAARLGLLEEEPHASRTIMLQQLARFLTGRMDQNNKSMFPQSAAIEEVSGSSTSWRKYLLIFQAFSNIRNQFYTMHELQKRDHKTRPHHGERAALSYQCEWAFVPIDYIQSSEVNTNVEAWR